MFFSICCQIHSFWSFLSYIMLYVFCCLVSGSHHSGSPLARGARYCMSADSSKVYTIPQTSSSGPEPEPGLGPEPGPGPSSEACGQARPQPGCKLPVGMKTTDDGDDDANSTEGPPSISECGWVCVYVCLRERETKSSGGVCDNITKCWALISLIPKSYCGLVSLHIRINTHYLANRWHTF